MHLVLYENAFSKCMFISLFKHFVRMYSEIKICLFAFAMKILRNGIKFNTKNNFINPFPQPASHDVLLSGTYEQVV